MVKKKKAFLALADGTVFEGVSVGAQGEAVGEVVFNTSLTGYEEILTDPSYKGQMVVMTYPHIGNYGTNDEDIESKRPWVEGFIVKEACPYPSNWRCKETIGEYLKRADVVAIGDIDTRALTCHIRSEGAMMGVISTSVDLDRLVEKARSAHGLVGFDLVKEVTCEKPYKWNEGLWTIEHGYAETAPVTSGEEKKLRVIAYDYGIKFNILRNLSNVGCDVTVVPASTSAEDVLEMKPDGVFLSNGPGDPEGVDYAVKNVKKLIGVLPIFGICLGHQILSLALGGRTFKLKFGHHGGNHPVKDLKSGKVEITVQNHGFAVDIDSLEGVAELTHLNLNDRTVEGIRHKEFPVFSVQYHPEASPGPRDSVYLFKKFVEIME